MAGTLYVVATPIGNLEDITARALRILREVQLIAAEDTRVTRKLLSHFDIHTPLRSFHEHSRVNRVEEVLERLRSGDDVALVSDAGTPGISDPGAVLVRSARKEGIIISPIPGPSCVSTILSVVGDRNGRFAFDGFPPKPRSDRMLFFRSLTLETRSIVLLESPRRLIATLRDIQTHLGDRELLIGRELTKRFEEIWTGKASEALTHFGTSEPRGEIIIVVEGMKPTNDELIAEDDVTEALQQAIQSGMSKRDAVILVSTNLKISKKQVYAASLKEP